MRHNIAELCNIEAEQAVLCAIIINNDCMAEVSTIIVTGDFYRETHRILFNALKTIILTKKIPADIVTLTDYFRASGEYDKIGGLPFLTQLANAQPTAANVVFHAQIVKKLSQYRQTVETANDLVSKVYEQDDDPQNIIASTQQNLAKVVGNNDVILHPVKDALLRILSKMGQSSDDGIPTGFPDLDYKLGGGMKRGQMYVIGGRPSMGKSAFTLNIIERVCSKGYKVLLHSLEMKENLILRRLLARRAGLPLDLVMKNLVGATQAEYSRYVVAGERIQSFKLEIDDRGYLTIDEIRSKAIALKAKYGLDILVIDHIGKLNFSKMKVQDRNNAIGDVCEQLHTLAIDLDIIVIIVSQLSREVVKRENKIPQLTDLRDSGSIEQDADVVIFVHRPFYYEKNDPQKQFDKSFLEDIERNGEDALLNVDKNRNDGKTGLIKLKWFGQYQSFCSLSSREDVPQAQEKVKKPMQYNFKQAARVGRHFADTV